MQRYAALLKSGLHNLGWIDDAGLDHVNILVRIGVIAFGLRSFC
jgi:hypothetical protein